MARSWPSPRRPASGQVIDVTSGSPIDVGQAGDAVVAMDLSDDGSTLALGLADGTVRIVPIEGGRGDQAIEMGATAVVVALDASGASLAVGLGVGRPSQVWDVASGRLLIEELPAAARATVGPPALALIWRDDQLFIGGRDRTMLFDTETEDVVVDDLAAATALAGRAWVDLRWRRSAGSRRRRRWHRDPPIRLGGVPARQRSGPGRSTGGHRLRRELGVVALAGATGIALLSTRGRGVLVEERLPSAGRWPQLSEDGSTFLSSPSKSDPGSTGGVGARGRGIRARGRAHRHPPRAHPGPQPCRRVPRHRARRRPADVSDQWVGRRGDDAVRCRDRHAPVHLRRLPGRASGGDLDRLQRSDPGVRSGNRGDRRRAGRYHRNAVPMPSRPRWSLPISSSTRVATS